MAAPTPGPEPTPGAALPPRPRLRLVTGIALAFLLLDSVLLVLAGVLTRTPLPFGLAVMALLLAAIVLLLQRRFTRRWDEIAAARQDLRAEVHTWMHQRRGP